MTQNRMLPLVLLKSMLALSGMRTAFPAAATPAKLTASSGEAPPGSVGPPSIAKLAFSELNKGLYEFCINLMGADALVDFDYTFRRPEDLDVSGTANGLRYAFLRVRANSIEGGTSEIMRNILGEQVLGLPGEPRVDKGLPWKDVPRN